MIIKESPIIPALRSVEDPSSINVVYPLISPFAYAHIYFNNETKQLEYDLIEPILSDEKLLEKIEKSVKENIDIQKESIEKTKEDYLKSLLDINLKNQKISLNEKDYLKVFYYLYRDFFGLNQIEPLMNDPYIEDIQCNGVNQPIYLVHRVYRNMKTNIIFKDMEKLAAFVEKLAQKCGRYISYANPILDGSLPDGSRVNATYTKDITSKGPTFTIRKFTKIPLTPINLIQNRSVSPETLAYFWILMENKLNVLVAGGTGSGKTTLLNAIAFFIPDEARVVSIEDTRELNLPRENWLPSVVREGLLSGGVGEVDMFSLLKASFRQIPDYVIVGEVRGKEAAVLFQGMASGHSSLATIHADSVDAVIRRLETPPIELSPSLVNELDVVAIMTHAKIGQTETRKLKEVVEIINVNPDGTSVTNTPLIWDPSKDKFYYKEDFYTFKKIEKRKGISYQKLLEEFKKRTILLNNLSINQKNISLEELKKIITEYYKNQENVLLKFGVSSIA
ncbi:MAG: type II/IV secretion system ATPase subunit [Candidatus Pacearchaeota archaeon]